MGVLTLTTVPRRRWDYLFGEINAAAELLRSLPEGVGKKGTTAEMPITSIPWISVQAWGRC